MARARTIGLTLAGLLTVIVIAQNTDMVEVRLLFTTLTMPRAVLLGGTLLVGFALGVFVSRQLVRGKRTPKSK